VTRVRIVLIAALAAGVATAVPLALARRTSNASASDDDPAAGTPTSTAEVTRRDLVERTELDGTLGFGDATDVALQRQGTLTALPAEGSTVERGQAIAEVDGHAVPLFYGERPMWRPLGPGVGDGADVRALEENLVALGYATSRTLTVDNTWTSATETAVKKWQHALGVEETGTVDVGAVAYRAGPVRVSSRTGTIGGGTGGPVLTVTAVERAVTVDLDAGEQDAIQEGEKVDVELPDGRTVPATVRTKGRVVHAPPAQDPGGSWTIDVVVALDDPAAAGELDEAPVSVIVTDTKAAGVLAVPVAALLALAEGGYAVERDAGGGARSLVGVEVGAFADGWVEVTGDIAEGDAVVVPA
jgi:hypothetical protein